jgi:alkaline phosphatase D
MVFVSLCNIPKQHRMLRIKTHLLTISALLLSLLTLAQPKDFRVLTGSCTYLHPDFEEPTGMFFRGDTAIFYSMSKTPADFILWLGDNWYLGEQEWTSLEGLRFKAQYTRKAKIMERLLARGLPEYAIWDDHDFGPDQSNQDYPLKNESRQVFMETWKDNPSFGENDNGIYTSFKKDDVLFILLDDRWWRDFDELWDYKWFKPNPKKRMFGKQQMAWLKKKLLEDTTSSFKIIASGSQILNPWAKEDCLIHFPYEYYELLDFIGQYKIEGVVFLTGDRHFSEIIKLDRKDRYPLYDVTVSAFTSSPEHAGGRERKNRYRVKNSLIEVNNYAQVSVSGPQTERTLTFRFLNNRGRLINTWQVKSTELKDQTRRPGR